MPKDDPCARALSRSLLVFVLQLALAAVFVLASLWVGSLALEWLNLVGVSTVPPGVRYHNHRHRGMREGVEPEGRRMSEVSAEVLTFIVVVVELFVLALVFAGFTCCVTRCFAPDRKIIDKTPCAYIETPGPSEQSKV